jgi:hypothetical protein
MANEIIKKARVLHANLPPILSDLNGYLVRYRVKSSDQNRTSHWSPFILIEPEYTFVPGSIKHTSASQIFNAIWDSVAVIKSYDSYSTITNKSLTDDIATITTSSAHYMNVGDYVTISGVDSTFNGTHIITAVTTTPTHTFSFYKDNANVTSAAVTPNGTYTKNYYIRKSLEYDVWIRWDRNDGGDWIYKERVQGTSISLPHPTTYTINGSIQPSSPNRVSIEIYLKGQPPRRGDGAFGSSGTPYLKVYQLLNETI